MAEHARIDRSFLNEALQRGVVLGISSKSVGAFTVNISPFQVYGRSLKDSLSGILVVGPPSLFYPPSSSLLFSSSPLFLHSFYLLFFSLLICAFPHLA